MSEETEFLRWLVENRSRNQVFLLKLHELIEEIKSSMHPAHYIWNDIDTLIGTGFSLWRAVFLGDVEDDFFAFHADAQSFLCELIKHNTISYVTDRRSRHWSFMYYVNNARYRLRVLVDEGILLSKNTELFEILSPTEGWVRIQGLADEALLEMRAKISK